MRQTKKPRKSGSRVKFSKARNIAKSRRKPAPSVVRVSITIQELGRKINGKLNVTFRIPGSNRNNAVSEKKLHRCSEILSATAHPVRLTILNLLLRGPAGYSMLKARTHCKAGPLYHHIAQLRLAGLILPKQRDNYELLPLGRNAVMCALAMSRIAGRRVS